MSRRDIIADPLLTFFIVKLRLSAVRACGWVFAILKLHINRARGLIFPLVNLNVTCLLRSAEKQSCGVNSSAFISNESNHEPTVRDTKHEGTCCVVASSSVNDRGIGKAWRGLRVFSVSTESSSVMVSLLNSSVATLQPSNFTRRCSSSRFNVK